jgi:hypothetical protein
VRLSTKCPHAKANEPPHGGERALPPIRRDPQVDPAVCARCNRVASNVDDLTPKGLAGVLKGARAASPMDRKLPPRGHDRYPGWPSPDPKGALVLPSRGPAAFMGGLVHIPLAQAWGPPGVARSPPRGSAGSVGGSSGRVQWTPSHVTPTRSHGEWTLSMGRGYRWLPPYICRKRILCSLWGWNCRFWIGKSTV